MKRVILLICLLVSLPAARAQQPDTPAADTLSVAAAPEQDADTASESDEALWDKANTAYLRSDFRTAIRTYREILDRGVASAKLYYNLGNACFKDDRLGEAILYYHRALRLAPGDEDARYNLSVAESRTKDRIETIPEFFLRSWMRSLRNLMSGNAWTILSLIVLDLAFACTLFYLLSQSLRLRKSGFYGTLCCAVLFIAATLFAAGARSEAVVRDTAVVMSSAVSVKSSPDKSATDLFVLHEGTSVRIGDSLGEWTEVTIADGKKGWIETRHITAI